MVCASWCTQVLRTQILSLVQCVADKRVRDPLLVRSLLLARRRRRRPLRSGRPTGSAALSALSPLAFTATRGPHSRTQTQPEADRTDWRRGPRAAAVALHWPAAGLRRRRRQRQVLSLHCAGAGNAAKQTRSKSRRQSRAPSHWPRPPRFFARARRRYRPVQKSGRNQNKAHAVRSKL